MNIRTLLFIIYAITYPTLVLSAHEKGQLSWEKNEFDTAYSIWLPSAERDDPRSQNAIGLLYLYGEGVEKNISVAIKWLKRAAQNGSSDAQANLGGIFYHDFDVDQDLEQAEMWYELSIKNGNKRALGKLADVKIAMGEYDEAEILLNNALSNYNNLSDKDKLD